MSMEKVVSLNRVPSNKGYQEEASRNAEGKLTPFAQSWLGT